MLSEETFSAAKEASSPTDVVGKLVEFGLSSSSETHTFAEEIFARVPHKTAVVNVSSFMIKSYCINSRVQQIY